MNYYKFKLWKDKKKKLFFYSNNSLNLIIEIAEKGNNYKNFQKIRFNQKFKFTMKKQVSVDWHIRQKKSLDKMSKNKKFLKLASFYSQLNSSEFTKKFISLMIFHLNIEIQQSKNIKQQRIFNYEKAAEVDSVPSSFSYKTPNVSLGVSNLTNFGLEQNKKIFSSFQHRNNVWSSKIFFRFSNRSFWWILLPTESILTHIRWNSFLKRIKKIFNIITLSTLTENHFNSNVLFDFFPEFLIEKPINWYWMLPFFGCLGLIRMDKNGISSYYHLKNQIDFNICSTFSHNQIENNLSWAIFNYFDYKKSLFNSSFKYINNSIVNQNHFGRQLKKTWLELSRQKEHYICNYKNDFVQKYLKNNLNQLTRLALIYWWKKNWEEITNPRFLLKCDSYLIQNPILQHFKHNKYLHTLVFELNINKNSKVKTTFYSFDSLFYSKFYWYWHTLDTKNIKAFINLNYSKRISKNYLIHNQKDTFHKTLSNNNTIFSYFLFYSNLVNKFVLRIPMNSEAFRSSSIFSMNEFPLKIQFSWFVSHFKIKKIINNSILLHQNFDAITEIIENTLKTIQINVNVNSKKKNNNQYNKNLIKIKKINLIVKNILYSNFIKNQNSKFLTDLLFPLCFNNNLSRSFFLFCVSTKSRSTRNLKEKVQNQFQLIKQEIQDRHDFSFQGAPEAKPSWIMLKKKKKIDNSINSLLKNKQKIFLRLTLYNNIGSEILESDLNPIYQFSNIKLNNIKEEGKQLIANQKNFSINNNFLKNYYLGKKKEQIVGLELEKSFDFSMSNGFSKPLLIEIQKNSMLSMGKSKQNSINEKKKKNQSISSFHRVSFLLNNLLSKFCFELGMTWLTAGNFIYYNYKILNTKKLYNKSLPILVLHWTSNKEEIIQTHQNAIPMSGYNLPHLNDIQLERNQLLRKLANKIRINDLSSVFPPNILYNHKKYGDFVKYNQQQYTISKYNCDTVLHFGGEGCNPPSFLIKKQHLCILKKKYRLKSSKSSLFDLKSKEFERFFIFNLLQNFQNVKVVLEKSFDMEKSFDFFYSTQFNKFEKKIKKNKIRIKIPKTKGYNTKGNYFDSMIEPSGKTKKMFNSLNFNNISKYLYVSNKSIFWNYINSTYSFRLLDGTQPFIWDKFDDFINNMRTNIAKGKIQKKKNEYFFSNLLLKKYQRKNKDWPGGAEPQGFFYKRINKLNFKSIEKKQRVERIHMEKDHEGRGLRLQNILNIQFQQLKKVSEFKPIAELLWEIRTKHKIPEVLLLQQTLFFQKKLVRKSTEEKNFINQYSYENNGLSQKVQTLLRKMTQRRYYRKHVFLKTLFDWTRDAISLRKMLRKINFKNDWQIFLKFILKSKQLRLKNSFYYSNWYKNNLSHTKTKRFVHKNLLSHNLNSNVGLNKNYKKIFKTDKIRSFFYKLIQIENNKKFFSSKKKINIVLKDFYKNLLIDAIFLNLHNEKPTRRLSVFFFPSQVLSLKKKKMNFYNNLKDINFPYLRHIKYIYNFNNLLIYAESKIFYYFSLPKINILKQFQHLRKKRNNINKWPHCSSLIFRNYDLLDLVNPFNNQLNNAKNNLLSSGNDTYYSNNLLNVINSHFFGNQQNLSKTCFPLYNKKKGRRAAKFNINKKVWNPYLLLPNFFSPIGYKNWVMKQCQMKKKNKIKQQSKDLNYPFMFNLSKIFNFSQYYKILQSEEFNKFYEINTNTDLVKWDVEVKEFSSVQPKSLEKIRNYGKVSPDAFFKQKSPLNYSSNTLSIRNHLFFQKLYFTNIFWHSHDFIFNTTFTLFNQNELIKNFINQNWVFHIRCIDSQANSERELNFNFHKVLATLSTWQYKFQIRRDFILQIFYIYLDHIGAFLNYILNNLIMENIFNQIENWNLVKEIDFLINQEPIKQNKPKATVLLNLKKKYFVIQPTWSFDLLNHIKIQYPHLYNQIQIKNNYNLTKIQFNTYSHLSSNLLIKTPEFDSKKQKMFSPNFKTQLLFMDSFIKNTGKNARGGLSPTYNMLSNVYNNSIHFNFIDKSIIQQLSSQSMIIRNSTLFCHKWIQNRKFLNFYKIQFLKKQQKLRQILNVFLEKKRNSISNFYNENGVEKSNDFANPRLTAQIVFPFLNPSSKAVHSLNSLSQLELKHDSLKRTTMRFTRRPGFLLNRSLTTKNFNSFSYFSKITRGSISLYLNINIEHSLENLLFFIQTLSLHFCLIFCLISVYQSAFHFCLKYVFSIFVILIHHFLNIRYRLQRLIKYVYQSIAQSFITYIQENVYSFYSTNNKSFVFFNNLSTLIFSYKFSIWGKIYRSSIPSLINFLFKNPFLFLNNLFLEKRIFLKSKNELILSDKAKKYNNLQSFFDNIKQKEIFNYNGLALNFKLDLIPTTNLVKIVNKKKMNYRMSLLRNTSVIKKIDFDILQNYKITNGSFISNQTKVIINSPTSVFWEKEESNQSHLLQKSIKKQKTTKKKNSSIFQFNFKLLKWNLGLILLIGESDVFAELEPYREMHWFFLKRLPIFLKSNIFSEDPINMYDYQADEILRKFKEQLKKSTEIFQKRQNTIERKTQRNRKKEHVKTKGLEKSFDFSSRKLLIKNSEKLNFELINKKYRNKNTNTSFLNKQKNTETIIVFIKSDIQSQDQERRLVDGGYINNISYLLNNFSFLRKRVSRGQPFWKPFFSFLAHTFFISRLSKLNRRFRDSILIMHFVWIPFGPLMSIFFSFLWKNWILNFSLNTNTYTYLFNQFEYSTKKPQTRGHALFGWRLPKVLLNYNNKKNNKKTNINQLNFLTLLDAQEELKKYNNLKFHTTSSSYYSPFQINMLTNNKISNFEFKQFSKEIRKILEKINHQNTEFSPLSPPLLSRIFLWNFMKFDEKYQRAVLKLSHIKNQKKNQLIGQNAIDFFKLYFNSPSLSLHQFFIYSKIYDQSYINKYKSIYINNQEQSAQNRYMHYKTYDPKVRLYRFYTNFSKNLNDIGIIQDAKNVHPIFGSLFCEIYSGFFSLEANKRISNLSKRQLSSYRFALSSTKNILLVGNTNSSNFVLLVQAFAAETGLKLFMEDAKRLRRLGRRGINKSTKRLEKLFEIAQTSSPSIVFLEDIDVIGSKRRIMKINEEEEDDNMAIRSFFSKLLYRKQHNYKSLSQSFINHNLNINNQDVYQNMQKSIFPKSPIPSNLIKYQLTRRKAFSNYFSNTSKTSYNSFITKFNILKKHSTSSSRDSNISNNISSSPTNAVIIWKLLKSKLVTQKKTIKETPWKHIPVDSMRSIPLITYSIRVKVAKLTMLAIYTMNTQLRLVKDLIKLLEKIQYESYKGFIVFGTTNKLSTLDPSLRRPGRFDETVYLPSLTVNPRFQRVGIIHFINVLWINSQHFLNFSRTFDILNASNFAMNWNANTLYGNLVLQDNSEKFFSSYSLNSSLQDLINSTAENVYNQNIFMQNGNNVYKHFISCDILRNIGFEKPNFSSYSQSVILLSLGYSKASQLMIQLFLKKKDIGKNISIFSNSKQILNKNKLIFNSENNELTLWSNSHLFSELKILNISYNNRQKNIKNLLIYFFAGKIGEFCFFNFPNNFKNKFKFYQKNTIDTGINNQKVKWNFKKFNYFFDKNSFGLRSLHGIQSNWKSINSVIFFIIRTSCFYSKNHLTSKLFYLDDILKKRQRIFSENLGPSLLYEYFHLNTESFLKRNIITLEEQLHKQQMQKYLLNLQKKPLRKFLFNSTEINKNRFASYINKINNKNILLPEKNKKQNNKGIQTYKKDFRLALFRILFNELGSLDLVALRPTAMNYYYDKKIVSKQRFRKYTHKWWNWHLKRTVDYLEEFQYLDFFPYMDKQYNTRRQRWILTNGYSAYWLSQEKILYYQIYEQLIIECFQRAYLNLDRHREMLDYLVQFLLTKQLLTEIEWIFFFKRFVES